MPRDPDDVDPVDPIGETLPSDEPEEAAFESLLRHVAHAPGSTGPDSGATAELAPGTIVGARFEVVEEIGRGGFARVYRARDRVLSRPVAIKLLARRRRLSDRDLELFYREAQATARLNHVHIVTAYDWGEWNGTPFLVLELLEGEALAATLARGPMPAARAFTIARDIARAVAYAHAQGVLHLDLKSQNVFVLADGRIKVLDFGLAGIEWDEDVPGGIVRVAGGTPATMAPEQEGAGDTDARTDVWAVGVILHELLFGRVPDKLPAGAASVPLPSGTSAAAERILRRTLARDPAGRYRDAASLLAALEAAATPARWRRPAVIAALALVLVAASAAVLFRVERRQAPAPAAATRARIGPPPPDKHRQLTFSGDVFQSELSPDGRSFAYPTHDHRELWQRPIASDQPKLLFQGEKLDEPRWFPDGTQLVVHEIKGKENLLWIVPTDGSTPRPSPYRRALNLPLAGGTSIASLPLGFADRPDVLVSALSGAELRRVPLPEAAKLIWDFDALPDGRLLVAAQPHGHHIYDVPPDAPVKLLASTPAPGGGARWDRGGQGIFFVRNQGRDAELVWMPALAGAAATVLVSGVAVGSHMSVSADGRRLLYHREASVQNLVRLGRDGVLRPVTRGTAEVGPASVSADGRLVAYAIREDQSQSIMVGGIEAGAPRRRLFRCPTPCSGPVWSPRGDRLAYQRRLPGGMRIALLRADGTDERVLEGARPSEDSARAIDWLSDHELVYVATGNGPLRVFDLDSGRERPLVPEAAGWMFHPVVSPDRSQVAFYWNKGHGDRGLWIADRAGKARLVFRGTREPVTFEGPSELILMETDLVDRPTLLSVERGDIRTGVTRVLWKPAAGVTLDDPVAIPGSDEIILLQEEVTSDAWLVEDPLGPRR